MRAASLVLLDLAVAVFSVLAPFASADEIPRPEHPNPQFQRDAWQNLNGTWDFWEGDVADEKAMAARTEFPDKIVVPFCRESKLSGLGRTGFVKNVLYRRKFAPFDQSGGFRSQDGTILLPPGSTMRLDQDISLAPRARLVLHIGACDWRTVVWVNGVKVASHEGGSTPIECDISDALGYQGEVNPSFGEAEIRIWAFDDTASGVQQLGKQCPKEKSFGCLYTRTTGIWQTVWLEYVSEARLDGVTMVSRLPEPDREGFEWPRKSVESTWDYAHLLVTPRLHGPCEGCVVHVEVKHRAAPTEKNVADGMAIDEAWGYAVKDGAPIEVMIRAPRLWTLVDPFLYDVDVTLRSSSKHGPEAITSPFTIAESFPVVLDQVHTYVGLRSVSTRGLAVLVNGHAVFQRLILDQGFYPDGIWTAPSDAALKHDIEMSMAAGFNGARLHQKVFEPRFLYWADKLGYLVWGEAPSWGANYANPAVDRVVLDEWRAEVERDRNHPSIVGWCPFNETDATPGRIQNAATALTRALDPTRPVLDTSGYVHSDPQRDVDDAHDYDQDPKSFRARWWPRAADPSLARYGIVPRDRPFFVSEFGGIGWIRPDERDAKNWSYGDAPKTEEEWFARFKGLCDAQLENPSLFGFCYTQLTDVEQERNGLYYYDRTPKFDVARLHAIVAKRAAIEDSGSTGAANPTAKPAPSWRVLVPARVDDPGRPWSFVALDKPLADDSWRLWKLDANGALAGAAIRSGRPAFGSKGGYEALIGTPWRSSELYLMRTFDFDGAPLDSARLVMHYDNAVELRLNGELLFEKGGWNDGYDPFDVTERAKAALKKGSNTLTVHVHQDSGGQFFDAALLVAPFVPPVER